MEIMKPLCFFFHGQHGQRYSSRAVPTTAAVAVEVSLRSHANNLKTGPIRFLYQGQVSFIMNNIIKTRSKQFHSKVF